MSNLSGKIDVVIAVGYAAEKNLLDEIKPADDTCQSWAAFLWALAIV
jgi:hypothetical protein